uniref:Putative lipocalin n=1 Tax=Ixodes ricinus TaxID=34613 RepID=A0A6B0UJB3_IXORI
MAHEGMTTAVFVIFFFCVGVSCSTLSSRCRKITFAERLGKYPDALELISEKSPKYSLVFHSQKSVFTQKTQCLQILNFEVDRVSWLTKATYAYYNIPSGLTSRWNSVVST